MSDPFDQFWAAYPRRCGANPKHPARIKFNAMVKKGTNPSLIISGAQGYAVEQTKLGNLRTEFVAMAVTWLNQRRWEDYPPVPAAPVTGTTWICTDDARWSAVAAEYRRQHNGKNPPTSPGLGGQGWHFPTSLMDTVSARNAKPADLSNQRAKQIQGGVRDADDLDHSGRDCKSLGMPGSLFPEKSPESVTHSTGGPNGAASAVFAKADR